jgi:PPP family 3-phenylpropionic acid transporter
MHTIWLFLAAYALLYGAFGVQSPFVPPLLSERGLQPEDIGLVLAGAMVVRVLAGPLVSHAADRLHLHTLILCGCALLSAAASAAYLLPRSFVGLFGIALIHAAMLGPLAPIMDALGATAAESSRGERRFQYGWLRAAGSGAFAIGDLASGWISVAAGLAASLLTSAGLLIMSSILVLFLPKLRMEGPRSRTSILRDGLLLLRIPVYRLLLCVASMLWGSHALHDSFAVIRWRGARIDFITISILWSESVLAEVIVFVLIGPWLIKRISVNGAMMLAVGAGVLRWSVAAFTTGPWILACIQPLHGLTFALFHLAAVQLIVAIVPVRLAATAQAVYGTFCVGVVIAIVTVASGFLYARFGGLAFLFMSGLCLIALPFCARLRDPHTLG